MDSSQRKAEMRTGIGGIWRTGLLERKREKEGKKEDKKQGQGIDHKHRGRQQKRCKRKGNLGEKEHRIISRELQNLFKKKKINDLHPPAKC